MRDRGAPQDCPLHPAAHRRRARCPDVLCDVDAARRVCVGAPGREPRGTSHQDRGEPRTSFHARRHELVRAGVDPAALRRLAGTAGAPRVRRQLLGGSLRRRARSARRPRGAAAHCHGADRVPVAFASARARAGSLSAGARRFSFVRSDRRGRGCHADGVRPPASPAARCGPRRRHPLVRFRLLDDVAVLRALRTPVGRTSSARLRARPDDPTLHRREPPQRDGIDGRSPAAPSPLADPRGRPGRRRRAPFAGCTVRVGEELPSGTRDCCLGESSRGRSAQPQSRHHRGPGGRPPARSRAGSRPGDERGARQPWRAGDLHRSGHSAAGWPI